MSIQNNPEWIQELYGAHWCPDWDFMLLDETCEEWTCSCAEGLRDIKVEWKTNSDI